MSSCLLPVPLTIFFKGKLAVTPSGVGGNTARDFPSKKTSGGFAISCFPQECLAARLRELNEGAVTHFRQNLNHYDEPLGLKIPRICKRDLPGTPKDMGPPLWDPLPNRILWE